MPWAEVICQVWFWYKRSRNHVYYHENNWRLVGHQVRIDNPTALLDPYDLEDLIAWKIDYDLLPIDLQNLLQTVAKETFSLISADNPDESKKLDPLDIEAVFHRIEPSWWPAILCN